MSDLFGNHIVGFSTRWLILLFFAIEDEVHVMLMTNVQRDVVDEEAFNVPMICYVVRQGICMSTHN